MSGLLFAEFKIKGKINAWRFLGRRAFKIYPAFYVFILASLAVWTFNNKSIDLSSLIGELTFLQNYVGRLWEHTWSLAVEEHFYILLAVFIWMVFTFCPTELSRRRSLVLAMLVVGCTCWYSRWKLQGVPFDFWIHQFPTHLRIDSLLLGVLLSYFWHFHKTSFDVLFPQKYRNVWLALGLIMLTPAFIFPISESPWISIFGFNVFAIASVFLVIFAVQMNPSTSVTRLFLTYIGSRSYSIYLWHNAMRFWPHLFLERCFGFEMSEWQIVVTYFLTSILAGEFAYRLVELPALALRSRVLPSDDSIACS